MNDDNEKIIRTLENVTLVCWIFLGIFTIIESPTRFTYAVLWICYVIEMVKKYIYIEDDDDRQY